MHECYAMQILEKQRQQRTMVTKSRVMKHKNLESQRWSGTQNHTNYLTKYLKLTSIKRFGEGVSILTFSRDILKRHNLSFNKIPNKMISNLYVLRLRVLNRILRNKKENKNNKKQWSQRVEQWSTRTKKAKTDQGHRITPIT